MNVVADGVPTAVMMSGACGTSVGAEQGGARVVWAANHNPRCIELHEANFPGSESVCQDLHLFNHAKMARHDMLLASPVCRVNSPASRPARAKARESAKANDPEKRPQGAALASSHNSMGALPWSVMDALEVNRPPLFVLENVPEWATDWPLYRLYLSMLRRLGYKITQQILDAQHFDLGDGTGRCVPQERERLFVIGTLGRKPIRVRPPKRKAGWKPTPVLGFVDWEGGEWLPFSEAGGAKLREQLARADREFGGRPAFINMVGHRPIFDAAREPLRTMTTQDQYRWVYRGRFKYPLPREMFGIMGFGPGFVIPPAIERKRTVANGMAGDAVSPPVMRAIVKHVIAAA